LPGAPPSPSGFCRRERSSAQQQTPQRPQSVLNVLLFLQTAASSRLDWSTEGLPTTGQDASRCLYSGNRSPALGLINQREDQLVEKTEVAVVGAGPSGLAVCACLRQRHVDFIILEKERQVGSSWHRHYERLHLHTIKSLSSLPFRNYDRDSPRYVPRQQFIRYLEDYALYFDLKPRFGETVRTVRRQEHGWSIKSTSCSINAQYVVVASGLNSMPVIPTFPGVENYQGHIVHGGEYFNATPFVGQNVLIVGMGNTGAEIALDLSENGVEPTISIRDGVHIVPRDLFGLPIQLVATLATSIMPRGMSDVVFPFILDFALGDLSKYGISRPRQGILEQVEKLSKIPVLDIGTAKRIREGRIKVRPGISAITAGGVIFDGGEKDRFDAIILATGYRPTYRDFLEISDVQDAGALPTGIDPNIFFVGFRNPVTGLLREISKEAKKVASDIVQQRMVEEIDRRV
jgi:cation diffusion facilitator CzcD-associated flavoprotein CzcO